MSNIAIKAEDLGKRYLIGKKKDSSLRSTLTGIFNGSQQAEEFWALKDLDFEINRGDVVGIIGKNGAGKSTLLKILSQITRPTTGKITLNGRVASLLEVGTGFHPELTGRENIYLNGTILGMTRKEVKNQFDEIVDFSGIEKFIDTPVKHYSSGMYVRLGFAVAAHLEPEILIIDEVLAVGDAEFQKKCLGKMNDVAKQGRTVLFVSHNLSSVIGLCNSGILIEKGEMTYKGDILSTINLYKNSWRTETEYSRTDGSKDIYISKASIISEFTEFSDEDEIKLGFNLSRNNDCKATASLLLRILDNYDQIICATEVACTEKDSYKELVLNKRFLTKGNYHISITLYQSGVTLFDEVQACCPFSVLNNVSEFSHLEGYNVGNVYIDGYWKH